MNIQDCRIEALTGKPDSLVIFFHGDCSTGAKMADYVGRQLSPLLPSAALRFPDGTQSMPWDSEDRTWLYIEKEMRDNPDGNILGPRAMNETPRINDYVSRVMAEEGMPASRVVIAGFSLGASMAFFSALLRDQPVAGVFSISGGALDQLSAPRSKPPVMLLAGEDEYSFYSGRQLAEKTHNLLLERGFLSTLFLTPANGHNIDRRSVEELAGFVKRVLPAPGPRIGLRL